jgi:hypothetical protein
LIIDLNIEIKLKIDSKIENLLKIIKENENDFDKTKMNLKK